MNKEEIMIKYSLDSLGDYLQSDILSVLEEYAKAKCEEQRKLCAQKANDLISEMVSSNGRLITPTITKKEMNNAPEPEFD